MYSYYNQTAAAAASTVVSTDGRVWNGSSWGVVPSGTGSTYNERAAATASGGTTTTTTTSSLVQLYTQYYHEYHKLASQYEANAKSSIADSTQRDEWMRYATWYRYYADQASMVANHYYMYPNSPPNFELPPPPPTVEGNNNHNHSVTNNFPQIHSSSVGHSQQSQQQPSSLTPTSTPVSSSTVNATTTAAASSPDGLKRFFHKCLAACTTDEQKEEVKAKLQQTISKAIQEGTLHATNWDAMEIIRPAKDVPIQEEVTVLAPQQHQQQQVPAANISPGGSIQKRTWPETGQPDASSNKRAKFRQYCKERQQNSLGNHHSHADGRSNSLTPFLESSTTSRVTPPLVEATAFTTSSSALNHYGPSSPSSSPSHPFHKSKKQLSFNDNYYGPQSSSSSPRNEPMYNQNYYGESATSGSSEEDFVAVPKFGRGKNHAKQSGFERSNSALVKRANRFGHASPATTQTNTSSTMTSAFVETANYDKYMGKGMIGGSNKKLDETDFEMMTVKGTCTRLEKEYLRLTAPPRAELVRPQHILERHYTNLVEDWKQRSEDKQQLRDSYYPWFCSQFKAMRQDCRVQRIQNAFCVRVYETHARMALESNDLNEFNQCQTQLMELYDLLLSSSSSQIATEEQDAVRKHRNEFLAYRFMYYVFLTGNHKGSSSSSDLMTLMLSLTPEQRRDPAISHAARVREAVASMDYHAFFRLAKNSPNLGKYLVQLMVPLIRFNALQRICKAYRPSVEVSFVLSELGFDDDNSNRDKDGMAWLESCGCFVQGDLVLTKDSVVRESNLQAKQSLI